MIILIGRPTQFSRETPQTRPTPPGVLLTHARHVLEMNKGNALTWGSIGERLTAIDCVT